MHDYCTMTAGHVGERYLNTRLSTNPLYRCSSYLTPYISSYVGNVRGTVAFSMDAVPPNKNCSSPQYCAQGFSTNIFINYANNTRLDPNGFAIFGEVLPPGMEVGSSITIVCPSGMESVVSRPSPDSSDVLLYLRTAAHTTTPPSASL